MNEINQINEINQEEIFNYLLKKKDELAAKGIEFYFDFLEVIPKNFGLFFKRKYFSRHGDFITKIFSNKEFRITLSEYKNNLLIDLTGEGFFNKNQPFYDVLFKTFEELLLAENIKTEINRASISHTLLHCSNLIEYLDVFFDKYYLEILNWYNLRSKENDIKDFYKEYIEKIINIKNKFIGYHITEISITDYKGIDRISIPNIPNHTKWILLTGENAYGKSSILQAIALGLNSSARQKEPTNFRIVYDTGISTIINANVGYANEEVNNEHEIDDIVCIGANRLLVTQKGAKDSNSILQLFPEGNEIPLQNIELEIPLWFFKRDLNIEFKEKYENVKRVLLALLPNVSDFIVDEKTNKLFYYEKDKDGNLYNPLTFDQLASGMKGIIAMVGDIILRLFKTQPHINNPSELVGIVIIDELELHLHPKWQIKLPKILSEVFPKIQFIASTHSPYPILGAPENSIVLNVERTKEDGITVKKLSDNAKKDANNSDISTLLLSFFNQPPLLSPETEEKLEKFYNLKTKEKLSKKEEIELSEIQQYFSDSYIGINIHDYRFLKFLKVLKKLGYNTKERLPDIELTDNELEEFRKEFEEYYK